MFWATRNRERGVGASRVPLIRGVRCRWRRRFQESHGAPRWSGDAGGGGDRRGERLGLTVRQVGDARGHVDARGPRTTVTAIPGATFNTRLLPVSAMNTSPL